MLIAFWWGGFRTDSNTVRLLYRKRIPSSFNELANLIKPVWMVFVYLLFNYDDSLRWLKHTIFVRLCAPKHLLLLLLFLRTNTWHINSSVRLLTVEQCCAATVCLPFFLLLASHHSAYSSRIWSVLVNIMFVFFNFSDWYFNWFCCSRSIW